MSNFLKLGLGGFEGPLHSSLQICNNNFYSYFCFNQQFGHIIVTIIDKPKKNFYNGATWHLMIKG